MLDFRNLPGSIEDDDEDDEDDAELLGLCPVCLRGCRNFSGGANSGSYKAEKGR